MQSLPHSIDQLVEKLSTIQPVPVPSSNVNHITQQHSLLQNIKPISQYLSRENMGLYSTQNATNNNSATPDTELYPSMPVHDFSSLRNYLSVLWKSSSKHSLFLVKGIIDSKTEKNYFLLIDQLFSCQPFSLHKNKLFFIPSLQNLSKFGFKCILPFQNIEEDEEAHAMISKNKLETTDPMNRYVIGDVLLTVVIQFDEQLHRMVVATSKEKWNQMISTLQHSKVENSVKESLPLGLFREENYAFFDDEQRRKFIKDQFNELLRKNEYFYHPFVVPNFLDALQLDGYASFQEKKFTITEAHDHLRIRTTQNKNYAKEMNGVQYTKKGEYENAKACYDRALEFDETCADAFVGKGAVYANEMKLKDAMEYFGKALEINPEHSNAKLYLAAAKTKSEQIKEDMKQGIKNKFQHASSSHTSHGRETIHVHHSDDETSKKRERNYSPTHSHHHTHKKQKQ